MNQKSIFRTVRIVLLGVVAMLGSASLLSAVEYQGKFTLPFEVRWGKATLPAGDYTFKLNMDVHPYTVKVTGKDGAVFVPADGTYNDEVSGRSEFIVVRQRGTGIIRALRLAREGLVFTYRLPKGQLQLMAEDPLLIQRIPITIIG